MPAGPAKTVPFQDGHLARQFRRHRLRPELKRDIDAHPGHRAGHDTGPAGQARDLDQRERQPGPGGQRAPPAQGRPEQLVTVGESLLRGSHLVITTVTAGPAWLRPVI